MIMVTGGRCQGKQAFVLDFIMKTPETEREILTADGRYDSPEQAYRADLVSHFESYVRRLLEKGEDPVDFTENLLKADQKRQNEICLITDEIGLGIVPIDPFERNYRETDGRLCQRLAAEAREVYRVICGLGIRIK